MIRGITLFIVAAHFWLASTVNSQESSATKTDVVLDTIFAVDMPGTKSIRELEPELQPDRLKVLTSHEQKLKLQSGLSPRISEVLSSDDRLLPGHELPIGFAVVGSPKNALRSAFEVLVERQERQSIFRRADELNVVFFSYLCGSYIHIRKITREGTSIEIAFEVVPHLEKHMTSNFALIPLGELPSNTYQVKVAQLPLAQEFANAGFKAADADLIKRFVSGSFSFEVED